MNKFLNKWFRLIHRWVAVPTALLILSAFVIKMVGSPEISALWEKWDKLPSILMLFMAITGSYLYLLPYIVRSQRKKKAAEAEMMSQ